MTGDDDDARARLLVANVVDGDTHAIEARSGAVMRLRDVWRVEAGRLVYAPALWAPSP